MLYFIRFCIKFQENVAKPQRGNSKALRVMDENLSGVPKDPLTWIEFITQMENLPSPGESCIANSLPFNQSKVVNPPPYPEGGPSGFHLTGS